MKKLTILLVILAFFAISINVFAVFAAVNLGPTSDITGDVNVAAGADYYVNGTAISTIYSPIAGGASITTTGTLTSGTAGTGFVIAGVTMTLGSDAEFDVYYSGASNVLTRLGPNTEATNKFFRMVGTGAAGQAPTWAALEAGDIPDISATYQAIDASLTSISGLTYASASYIELTAEDTYAVRTLAQVKEDLDLEIGTDIAACGANTDITSILNAALYVGRDADNQLNWATDDQLDIIIGAATTSIVSVSTGAGDNDKLVTQGYVDDAAGTSNNFILHCMDIDAADTDYVHAAITGTGGSNDVSTAITNPDYGRIVTVTCTNNNSPTGDITITGTTACGETSATDAITISAGGTAAGVKAFTYISNINVPAGVPAEDDVTIGIGDVIGLQNSISAEADVYMKTVDGVEEYGEIAGNTDTTNNTVDCATIVQNEDITFYYHN